MAEITKQEARTEARVPESLRCDHKKGSDLELIRRNPNPKFLIDTDVLEGVAEHVVGDIDYWFENIKRPRTEE